jgi:hypothetical protein
MNLKFTQDEKKFLGKLVIATGFAWPVGFIVTILLSYGVVKQFYPKDTNLIAGFCLGAFVAYSQWFIIKRYFKISAWWIFAAAIGMGLPFVIEFILFELRGNESSLTGIDMIDPAVFLFVCGLLAGLLQYNSLKSLTSKFRWWIIISALAWGLGWFGLILGGVIFGFISGITFLHLFKLPVNVDLDKGK